MVSSDLNNLAIAREKFIDNLKENGRANATILAYGKDIDQFVEFNQKNSKNQVGQILTEDIEAFKKDLATNNYTPKSISRKVNSIKTFFRMLREKGVLITNPAETIRHPKYEARPPRILSALEYRSLRDVCRDDVRISTIVEVLLQTGVRIGELANLTLDDIKDKKIIIQAFESHPDRYVPLNKAAEAAIKRYLAIRPKTRSKSLFITKTGKRFLVRNIRTAINRYFKLAGLELVTVNDLRNTFIAHQLKAGIPLTTVSKIVGHKRLITTEKYLDIVQQRRAAKKSVKIEEL